VKLYYSPGACSLSPHIALREAGLPFDMVQVDLKTKHMAGGGDFTEVNGKGYVPVLQLEDGQVLTEGPAIVQYVADRRPEMKLAPAAGTIERYRLQEWLNFVTSELHKSFGPLFNPSTSADWKQAILALLGRRFDWLAPKLAGRDYLMGQQFTVADGYLFTVLNWGQWVNVDLARWPAIAQYRDRVAERPKVRDALKAEGLLK
jgi:glutathione S-transferase